MDSFSHAPAFCVKISFIFVGKNTLIYMIGIPIGMILGIIISMGLNRKIPDVFFLYI